MKSDSASALQTSFPGFNHDPRYSQVSRARLPTNTTANRHAIHRWFNFIAGFAPEFVAQQCPADRGAVLLDPFAGCGTSLIVAQSLGHRAIGFEPHPCFIRIARAKTQPLPNSARLQEIEEVLLTGILDRQPASSISESAQTFLDKLFDASTLRQLLGARAALEASEFAQDDLAFLLLSRAVDMCSKAQTDGIYKAPTSAKKPHCPVDAIRTIVAQVKRDAAAPQEDSAGTTAVVHEATSEDMRSVESGSIDLVVTSPPYLNNFDFAEMTRMYLYFWGMCGTWREITELVRAKLVVNTTTALAGQRELQAKYRESIAHELRSELDRIVAALAGERRVRAGKKEYDFLVYPYFAQMTRILLEMQRCLSLGGIAHIVVADAAFYGIHISTPQFLAVAMAAMGFGDVECIKLRKRGHRWVLAKRDGSPIGLGEYHLVGKRVSAI